MRRRRYVYSYSPRRGLVQRQGISGRLILVVLGVIGLALVFAWSSGLLRGSGATTPEVVLTNRLVNPQDESGSGSRSSSQERELQGGSPQFEGDADPPRITATAAVIVEEPCGTVIYKKNADMRVPPASLTKIATALVAIDQVDPAETVTVDVDSTRLSAETDATVMGLSPGQELSVLDLLYGMLLPSGNDAAIALAEYVSGSTPEFADLMNAKADELSLEDTHFTNPHGLDDPALYTSAYDIASLGWELLQDPVLSAIVRTPSYQPNWAGPTVENHNLLLSQYPGAVGVKTGYTDLAGQTLVAAARRNGRLMVVSALGSQDIYVDAIALLDWAFYSASAACTVTQAR